MNRIRKIKQVLRSRPTIEDVGVHLKRAFGFIGGDGYFYRLRMGQNYLVAMMKNYLAFSKTMF